LPSVRLIARAGRLSSAGTIGPGVKTPLGSERKISSVCSQTERIFSSGSRVCLPLGSKTEEEILLAEAASRGLPYGHRVPHIVIECSGNLGERTDLGALVEGVHDAALATGLFPIGGLRTRLAERTLYRIADGDPANAFCHVVVRIGHGRDAAAKRAGGEAIFRALCDALAPAFANGPLGISLEVQEIDPELSFKLNNLHAYVAERRSSAS